MNKVENKIKELKDQIALNMSIPHPDKPRQGYRICKRCGKEAVVDERQCMCGSISFNDGMVGR